MISMGLLLDIDDDMLDVERVESVALASSLPLVTNDFNVSFKEGIALFSPFAILLIGSLSIGELAFRSSESDQGNFTAGIQDTLPLLPKDHVIPNDAVQLLFAEAFKLQEATVRKATIPSTVAPRESWVPKEQGIEFPEMPQIVEDAETPEQILVPAPSLSVLSNPNAGATPMPPTNLRAQ